MRLTIPQPGAVWQAGSQHFLAWDGPADARIEYSLDAGKTWQPIPDDGTDRCPPADPYFAPSTLKRLFWNVPPHPGSCRLRTSAGIAEIRIAPSAERRYRWEPVTLDALFAARDGAGALTFKDRMWLLGGWNPKDPVRFPGHCNSEVWSSRDGRDWTLVNPAAPWEKRHTAGYVVHRDKMWIVGGDPIQGHYQNDVWNSADGIQWERVAAAVPWADRVLHYTVAHADRIWVIGGQNVTRRATGHLPNWPAATADIFYNDVWSSADGLHWTRVCEHAPWQPRGLIGGAAVKDGYIWLLGGGWYYERYFPEVWRSADGAQWELVSSLTPWYPRYYHDVAVFDDRLWVMEGASKSGNRNDIWYSTDGCNWYELPGTPWSARHAASVFVHGGALWMVAGNNMTPDVWRLTL